MVEQNQISETKSDCMYCILYFQEEVVREAGEEALDLGMLIGAEDPNPQEEETEMLCFPHLLFQEFVAANYVSVLTKVLYLMYQEIWAL